METGNRRKKAYKKTSKNQRRYPLWPGLIMLVLVSIILMYQNLPIKRFDFFRHQDNAENSEQTTTSADSNTTTTTTANTAATEITPEPSSSPVVTVELIGVGDIILHDSVIEGGRIGNDTQEYDYTPIFQYIKPIVSKADLAMMNYEGTLAKPPYSGFPFFNAPDEIADALLDTGFTVAGTANNHILDKGLDGLLRTTEVFQDKGFHVIGTRLDESGETSAIVDVNGIKVGLLAYTYETVGIVTDGVLKRGLNGIPIPDAALPLLDSYNPYRTEVFNEDFADLLAHVAQIRESGAEIICLALHWGEEYQTEPRPYQKQMASDLADAGVDIIFGHHPHVLQPIEIIQSEVTAKPTVIFYSTSNLLANMLYTTHDTQGKAQDAIIARVVLIRDEDGLRVEKAEYIPTHIVRDVKGQGWQHLVVPVLQALEDPAAYKTTYEDMKASLERIENILGSDREDIIPVFQVSH